MSLVNFNNIKEFDLNKIVQIQVPINGKNEYIRRISTPSGQTLWQVYETDILYKDNIPVTLTYDMNPNTSSMFYQSNENLMYLIPVGNINRYDNILKSFTNTAYAHTPIHINWSTTNETTIGLKIRTGNNVTSRQELFGMQTTDNFELEILNGKIHWELTGTSGIIINANTDYFIEFKKVKTRYTITVYKYNNNTLVKHGTITASSSRSCSNQYLYLGIDKQNSGIEPFDGTIDCKESYIIYNNKKYKFRI